MRRLAIIVVIALVGLAAMFGLLLFALSATKEAREQTRAAEAGALAAKARQLEANAIVELDRDPELGLLLAAQAARMTPDPDAATDDVLRRALRESRVRTVARLGAPVSDLTALPGGLLAAATERGGVRLVAAGKAGQRS